MALNYDGYSIMFPGLYTFTDYEIIPNNYIKKNFKINELECCKPYNCIEVFYTIDTEETRNGRL